MKASPETEKSVMAVGSALSPSLLRVASAGSLQESPLAGWFRWECELKHKGVGVPVRCGNLSEVGPTEQGAGQDRKQALLPSLWVCFS